jgi:hypothetical protein
MPQPVWAFESYFFVVILTLVFRIGHQVTLQQSVRQSTHGTGTGEPLLVFS